MGEDKILDPPGNSAVMSLQALKKEENLDGPAASRREGWPGMKIPMVFGLCALLFLSSCAFPRIIILKDPLTPEEHLNLGVAYEQQGELEAAVQEYKQAAKKLAMAYLYIGNVHFQKKEWDEAERNYRKAIRQEPGNADAANNLAWLYYTKKENLDRAETLARQALELNPAKEKIYRDTLEKILQAKQERNRRTPGL
jgi:tetratricopeptide (TPR) repeat protein